MQSVNNGSFESLESAKNFERLSKEQSSNQATDQSGTVDFFISTKENARPRLRRRALLSESIVDEVGSFCGCSGHPKPQK
jgi:hypothetical protein